MITWWWRWSLGLFLTPLVIPKTRAQQGFEWQGLHPSHSPPPPPLHHHHYHDPTTTPSKNTSDGGVQAMASSSGSGMVSIEVMVRDEKVTVMAPLDHSPRWVAQVLLLLLLLLLFPAVIP